jgi:hypothetical protein
MAATLKLYKIEKFDINFMELSVMEKDAQLVYLFLYTQIGKNVDVESLSIILDIPESKLEKLLNKLVVFINSGK